MADERAARFEALVEQVLAPLVLGGRVDPVRPFGPRLGLAIGEGRKITDPELRSRLDVARVRVARLLAPVDTVAELSPEDFALTAALNDLLQASNRDLSGAFTRGRHARLLTMTRELCAAVPRPRTIDEALSRHTVFARALELYRTDTTVSWWTGSSGFRGRPAPARLLKWRELRRVREDTQRVPLVEMAADIEALPADAWLEAISAWIARSPLTDLATAARRSPPFRWTDASLSLISTVPGRTLAFRAISRQGSMEAIGSLERAAALLVEPSPAAHAIAAAFVKEVSQGLAAFGKRVA